MRNLMKIKKEKREIGRAKKKIEGFKKCLQETSGLLAERCMAQVIQNRTQSIFFFINAE